MISICFTAAAYIDKNIYILGEERILVNDKTPKKYVKKAITFVLRLFEIPIF